MSIDRPFQGGLFSGDYLEIAIAESDDWQAFDDAAVVDLEVALAGTFARFQTGGSPNESETEDELIWPVLERLGWTERLRQQNLSARGMTDVPDGLLFADSESKAKAAGTLEEWRRYEFGLAVVESKRWGRALDRGSAQTGEATAPSTQMLRYLRRADDPKAAARAIGQAGTAAARAIARDSSNAANVPGYGGTDVPERNLTASGMEDAARGRLGDPDDPGGTAGRAVIEGVTVRPERPVAASDPGVVRGKGIAASPQSSAHRADGLASGGATDCEAGLEDAEDGGSCGQVRWCVWSDERREARDRVLARLGERYGLIYLGHAGCAGCKVFGPLLRAFAKRHDLDVLAVSLSGEALEGWPEAVADNGRAARLGLGNAPVPALVLFDTKTKRVLPVGFGVMAEDQMAERIFALTALEPGNDY